jgi:uncharacterized protein (DUF433 family)
LQKTGHFFFVDTLTRPDWRLELTALRPVGTLGAAVGMNAAVVNCGTVDASDLLSRISIDPNICFGKPCVRGHRIWVSLILDLLASGSSVKELLEDYPGLVEEDVLACLAYGAEMSRERYVDVPLKRTA